jgi:hypothetical protein
MAKKPPITVGPRASTSGSEQVSTGDVTYEAGFTDDAKAIPAGKSSLRLPFTSTRAIVETLTYPMPTVVGVYKASTLDAAFKNGKVVSQENGGSGTRLTVTVDIDPKAETPIGRRTLQLTLSGDYKVYVNTKYGDYFEIIV